MKFDWNPAKRASNQATALGAGSVITLPSKDPGELRHLAIGLIEGRHWTVINPPRDNSIRLISARRSRKK